MPLYEFRCPEGHEFEKFFRSISSAPSEVECIECGKPAARKISPAGLVFRGSGFYITDYGKDGKKAEREATKAAKKPAEKTPESKSSESGGTGESKSSAADKPDTTPPPSPSSATTKKPE